MAVGGELTFLISFLETWASTGEMYEAIAAGIAADAAYIGTAMGGALTGKLLGNQFKAQGGPIQDMGHFSFGDVMNIVHPLSGGIYDLFAGNKPSIPLVPGLINIPLDPRDQWDNSIKWVTEAWDEFCEANKGGWFNFAEAILTPGEYQFDGMDGMLNELQHFWDWLISTIDTFGKPPGSEWSFEKNGGPIPSYGAGIDYIPYDTMAYVHRGEKITPAAENARETSLIKNGGLQVGELKIYLDGQEVGGRIKVIADGHIVERNQRGISPTQRIYQ